MIGKAIYEGILLDCSFAVFLLAKILGRNVFLEALQELDEDVWRNLIFLKHYEGIPLPYTSLSVTFTYSFFFLVIGNVEDLGLTFATDEKKLDSVVTTELKYVRLTHTTIPTLCLLTKMFIFFFSSMDSILGSPMTTNWNTFI
jgi:ubiquitin-protein ligase E3 B